MANITKFEFVTLDISGKNYMSWVLDADGLGDTIKPGNNVFAQNKAKIMIFLRCHLDENLKTKYLIVKDPFVLWISLKEIYDHLKMVVLPKARYDWIHLWL